jgi:hypothetical protein
MVQLNEIEAIERQAFRATAHDGLDDDTAGRLVWHVANCPKCRAVARKGMRDHARTH